MNVKALLKEFFGTEDFKRSRKVAKVRAARIAEVKERIAAFLRGDDPLATFAGAIRGAVDETTAIDGAPGPVPVWSFGGPGTALFVAALLKAAPEAKIEAELRRALAGIDTKDPSDRLRTFAAFIARTARDASLGPESNLHVGYATCFLSFCWHALYDLEVPVFYGASHRGVKALLAAGLLQDPDYGSRDLAERFRAFLRITRGMHDLVKKVNPQLNFWTVDAFLEWAAPRYEGQAGAGSGSGIMQAVDPGAAAKPSGWAGAGFSTMASMAAIGPDGASVPEVSKVTIGAASEASGAAPSETRKLDTRNHIKVPQPSKVFSVTAEEPVTARGAPIEDRPWYGGGIRRSDEPAPPEAPPPKLDAADIADVVARQGAPMRLGKLGEGDSPRRSSGEHPAAATGTGSLSGRASPEAKRADPAAEPASRPEPVVETKRVKSAAEAAAERGSQSAYSKPTEFARAVVDAAGGAPKSPPGSESVKATVLLKAPTGGDSSGSLRPVAAEPAPGPGGATSPAALADLARETRFPEALLRDLDALLARRGQVALEGPTGVGKTHLARRFAAIFAGSPQRVRFVQLHPGYRYEDFVEARGQSGAGAVPGVFKTLASRAAADPAHRYVLVLDELGRGDSVGVLGEVFSLLEYRGEEAILPYSRESFAVPKNLFVLATASTSGARALDDAALRRRFHFLHLAPSAEILRGFLERNHPRFAWVADLFSELNRRLAKEGGPRAQLGQSVFMQPALDDGELERIFVYDVRPLVETTVREPARLAELELGALRAAVGAPAGAARG